VEKAEGTPGIVICVAGMPRSGTSLVTQALHRCGLHLGRPDELMPAAPDNTDGYWEHLAFVQINERLLAANGGTWFAPPATLHPTPSITAAAQAAVAAFDGREPWGWKDPRNAVTLPFWQGLLPAVQVIVCLRHPAETAASLAASALIPRTWRFYWPVTRDDSPIALRDRPARRLGRLWGAARASMSKARRRALIHEVGVELWRVYNTSLLEATRTDQRLVTDYDAILRTPRAELERIVAFAGLRPPAAALEDAVRLVSPRLRHQRAEAASLTPETEALYARLLREARA
jgi:hypothetical protein